MDEKKKSLYANLMGHAIGLDNGRIKKIDGAPVFKPYRNYYSVEKPEKEWEDLVEAGYAKKSIGEMYIRYSVTPNGVQWLVNYSRINICLTY